MSWREAAEVIVQRAGIAPRVGVVLGSGLGEVADAVEDATVIPYSELPGFPAPGVEGHAGRAVAGQIGGVPVIAFQGRAHLYEGVDLDEIRVPVRALKAAGAEMLVLTNAAGSLRFDIGPGGLMLIEDHINMTGVNVLAGPNVDELGPRFPSLRDAYDPQLRADMRVAARDIGVELNQGVYLAVRGPTFETPGRDPRLPHARGRRRRHVHRPRDDDRAALRAARRRGLGDHQLRGGDERGGGQPRADAARRRARGG